MARQSAPFRHPLISVKKAPQIKGETEAPTPQKACNQLRWIAL